MQFELLYFDGCPSWHQALENLRQALTLHGLDMEVSLIQVKDNRHAIDLQFPGSPTLRISGNDLFPEHATEFGLSCRVYGTEEGLIGWPTMPMILERLRALASAQAAAAKGEAA